MTNYPISDFLIRLKNISLAGKKEVLVDSTKLITAVAQTLKKEKFLESVEQKDGKLLVKLAVFNKKPVLSELSIVSKPGLRVYVSVDNLEKKKTPETWIISTHIGIISDKEARKQRVGGELIAKVI